MITITKRVVTLFITGILVVGGIIAFNNLGRLEDPEFTIKTAVITTSYPGASPEEVEQEVTERIELKLQEIKEIDVELATNYDALVSNPEFFDTYQQKKQDLQELMQKWEDIQLEIEAFS